MPPKEIKNREQNSVKLDANNNSRVVAEQSSSIPFRSKKLSYSMEKITWSSSSSSNSSLSSSFTSPSSPTKTGGIKLNNPVSETSKPILRICGNLEKMSLSGLKLWRKRYFVLTDNILQYFSDPSKSKHCGTIFLSGTYTRPTIKKDGSAFNKKYSFKVDMIRPNLNQSVMSRVSAKNNDCAYFAADSLEHMNEWINYFNLASQIKANNRSRDKSQFGKASHGSSIRSSSSESVNHVTKDHNGTLANHEPSKRSISAPNSPMAAKHSITINENANKIHPLSTTIQAMPSSSRRSQSSNSRSNKEIYESFEKPTKHSNDRQKSVIVNLVRSTNNTDSADTFKKSNMDREKIAAATIAANNAAAAAIAKEKEKSRLMSISAGQKPINSSYLLTQKQQHMDQTDNSINMFYNLSMLQMDILPKIIEKLFKNQAITHSKELPNGVHLLNQLNSLNHNMELLQSQLAEFNLILNDSMRQQQNERQQHLSHANGAEMYSHLFLNNPTPQNGEEDFNQNESVKINPNSNPIGFNQHLRSGFKPVNESRSVNFKRDLILTNGNNMRPLVGKMPSNYYSQNTTMFESKSNELLFKPIPIKSYQPLSNANKIFAANNMRMEASQFEIQKAFMDSQLEEHSENPETKLNPALSQIINDIAHQNEMEYFDIDQYGKDLVNILYPEKEFRINEIS